MMVKDCTMTIKLSDVFVCKICREPTLTMSVVDFNEVSLLAWRFHKVKTPLENITMCAICSIHANWNFVRTELSSCFHCKADSRVSFFKSDITDRRIRIINCDGCGAYYRQGSVG